MTDARISRAHLEVLTTITPDLRISRAHLEVLYSINATIVGGLATETDTALAGTILGAGGSTVTGGLATETDTALAGSTIAGAVVVGGLATETDTALTGTVVAGTVVVGGLATETDSALAGSVGAAAPIAGGQATETDTALAGTVVSSVSIAGGLAAETDTALAGTIGSAATIAGGLATETDMAITGTLVGSTFITVLGGYAAEIDAALRGGPVQVSGTGGTSATVRWLLYDPVTAESYRMPINPDSMTPILRRRDLRHVRGAYGVTSTQQAAREEEFDWSGVIRSQAHYDALVTWASKRNALEVTDHVGRRFRVYVTDFQPTDRSPIPKAPTRWRYTMKTKLLEAL